MFAIVINSESTDPEFYGRVRKLVSDAMMDEWEKDVTVNYSIDASFNPNTKELHPPKPKVMR